MAKHIIAEEKISRRLNKNNIFTKSDPNMAKVKGAITVNISRCKGCNLCVVACPTATLALKLNEVNDRGYRYAFMEHPDKCTGCSSCAWVCPDACIEVYRVKPD